MNTKINHHRNCHFSIAMTQTPDDGQCSVISSLLASCRQNGEAVPDFLISDSISHSDLISASDSDLDCCSDSYFLFLTVPDETLPAVAVLELSVLDEETAECRCAVLPDFRRRGFFSALLEEAEALAGERDILFSLPDTCTDGLAVMRALEAECLSTEYEMARHLELAVSSKSEQISENFPETILSENIRWELTPEKSVTFSRIDLDPNEASDANAGSDFSGSSDTLEALEVLDTSGFSESHGCLGSCLTTRISDTCVCLHHVEIRKSLRKRGLGTALICGLLAQLPAFGITRIILQVSGDNAPALSLYKKTGFAITQSLSYYLY